MELKDTKGRFRTASLFIEYTHDEYPAYYTVKDQDVEVAGVKYRSLRKLYMEVADPTEHAFVKEAFDGNWEQWRKLQANDAMATILKVQEWAPELAVKLKSIGVKRLIEIANDKDNKSSASAARWLAEQGFAPKTRGRPSEDEKEGIREAEEKFGKEFAHVFALASEAEK
jgi:hypothetical protein